MATEPRGRTHGLILGKFLPPHQGHVFLGDFARRFADELTILVCSIQREPIPGDVRYGWMRELFPFDRVIHLTEELPQEPAEHPDFWPIWRETIRRLVPERLDYVFASEEYGVRLAGELGARFIPVDPARAQVPVSGTAVRSDPLGCWQFLPPCVRSYFVRRVCVFGPESTGKSTLARQLAARFETVHVEEFARELLSRDAGRCLLEDIPLIARGQAAAEDSLARQANRVLICDTDLLTTTVWSEVLFGECPPAVAAEAARRRYDLYLLLDVDVPWVNDGERYLGDQRQEFFRRCRQALEVRQRPYVLIRGNWTERFDQACRAVEQVLAVPEAQRSR
jgi:HTH-type transcriptional regulator, transcriptional repressor of NAD biosynthesis genes